MEIKDLKNTSNYGKYIMTNNLTNERIIGFGLKATNKPKVNYTLNKTIAKYRKPKLCLELDSTQDLVITDYIESLIYNENIRRARRGEKKWLSSNISKFTVEKNVINISCGELSLKITKIRSLKKANGIVKDKITLVDILSAEYIDEENSFVDKRDNACVLLDLYKLGNLNELQIQDIQSEYFDLLNYQNGYEGKIIKYNRAATPYVTYDKWDKKCYVGLWSLQDNRALSKYNACNWKYDSEIIFPKIKKLCENYFLSQVINSFDLDLFGVKIEGCVLLK